MINFSATKVFDELWTAINLTHEDENGRKVRTYRTFEEVGGSRSSKTWSNFQIIFLYGHKNRMKNIVAMRDTAVDCRDKVETDFVDWLRDPNRRVHQYEEGLITVDELDAYLKSEDLSTHLIENKSKHTWTFKKTGSVITFTGTDDENRAIGKSQDVLWVNEPYMFSEEVFKQLTQRTRDFIIVDWNPKQNHFIEKLRLKKDTFSHKSSLLDNPFCPLESRKQILSYQPLRFAKLVVDKAISVDEATDYDFTNNPISFGKKDLRELERCVQNEYQKTASEYHYKVFMLGEKAEKPNRILSGWKKIPRKQYDDLDSTEYIGCDWGKNHNWGILGAKFYDGTLYLREMNYASEVEIMKYLPSETLQQFKKDESKEGENLGIVSWMFTKLGINKKKTIVCDNNRPLKIAMLRRCGWDYAVGAQKGQGSILDGLDLLEGMDVCYTDDSPNLANEYENYSYIVDRYGIVTDEPEDANNHLIDPARYICQLLVRLGLLKRV